MNKLKEILCVIGAQVKTGWYAVAALFALALSSLDAKADAVADALALKDDAVTIFGYVTGFLLTVAAFYIMWSIVKGLRRK